MRKGVTLIELLIVITIISMLAALVVGIASVVGESSRRHHTEHVVGRLHTLIGDYVASFKEKRVSLRQTDQDGPGVEQQIHAAFKNPDGTTDMRKASPALAEARLYALREMLIMEIPDRWSDVTLAVSGQPEGNPMYLDAPLNGAMGVRRTQLANIILRKYRSMVAAGIPVSTIQNNQGAECLFLIVMNATGDGEARTLFGESTIADVDGDGANEFVDGWGHPINFLRWAPGFESQIQNYAAKLTTNLEKQVAADSDHDPFDRYRFDRYAYRLLPLIYSPGGDEDSGLVAREDYVAWSPKPPYQITFNNNGVPLIKSPQINPTGPIATGLYLGADNGEKTSTDNVHNHLLGKR